MTPLALELGQVEDPTTRRALEQISLRWPTPPTVPLVDALPATSAPGSLVFLRSDNHLYVFSAGWKMV
jgi:hypothetical protein